MARARGHGPGGFAGSGSRHARKRFGCPARAANGRGDFLARCRPLRRQHSRCRIARQAGQRSGQARVHLRGRIREARCYVHRCSARHALGGISLDGNGKIELSGYTGKELAASAHGALHFECRRGAIGNQPSESSKAGPVPASLGRFNSWTADANLANGSLTLDQNLVSTGARKQSVQATVTFGDPPVVSFAVPKQLAAKQR